MTGLNIVVQVLYLQDQKDTVPIKQNHFHQKEPFIPLCKSHITQPQEAWKTFPDKN